MKKILKTIVAIAIIFGAGFYFGKLLYYLLN
jgi:uncharacterized protein YxeA